MRELFNLIDKLFKTDTLGWYIRYQYFLYLKRNRVSPWDVTIIIQCENCGVDFKIDCQSGSEGKDDLIIEVKPGKHCCLLDPKEMIEKIFNPVYITK